MPNTEQYLVDEAIRDGTFERLAVDMVLLGKDAAEEPVLDTESHAELEQSTKADQSQRPLEAFF